ncbi:HAD family hydrolase [Metabacillus halosaccharovorans]|uniref:HAD family hydrolase n=1 Tax=Metabacillus halosaccharovorans TaxID=930124 RepID=UPI0034CD38D0
MNLKYDAIVFDFDGVLVESVNLKTQAFAELYLEYGQDIVDKVVKYHLQNGGVSRFLKFKYFHEVLLGKQITDEELNKLSDKFTKIALEAIVKAEWVKGADDFLNEFQGKIPMFVASGTPDGELKEIIKQRDMEKYFVSVHGTPTKKGTIINAIIKEYGFDRNRVLMVGDALADLEGATEANVNFLGRVAGETEDIFPSHVTSKVRDLTSLSNFVINTEMIVS